MKTRTFNRWFWDEGISWLILAILCLAISGLAVGCKKNLPTSPDLDPIIDPPAQLVASCEASVTEGEAPLIITFIGTVSGGVEPYSYAWDFGDEETSDLQNPEHEYLQCGSYAVTFTVTDCKEVQASASLTIKLYSAHKVAFVARVYVQINVEWSDAFLYNLYCDDELIASITQINYSYEHHAVVGEVTGSVWGLYPGQHTFTFELVESLWGDAYSSRAYLLLEPIDTTITIVPTEMDTGGNFEWEIGDRVEFVFTITEN